MSPSCFTRCSCPGQRAGRVRCTARLSRAIGRRSAVLKRSTVPATTCSAFNEPARQMPERPADGRSPGPRLQLGQVVKDEMDHQLAGRRAGAGPPATSGPACAHGLRAPRPRQSSPEPSPGHQAAQTRTACASTSSRTAYSSASRTFLTDSLSVASHARMATSPGISRRVRTLLDQCVVVGRRPG